MISRKSGETIFWKASCLSASSMTQLKMCAISLRMSSEVSYHFLLVEEPGDRLMPRGVRFNHILNEKILSEACNLRCFFQQQSLLSLVLRKTRSSQKLHPQQLQSTLGFKTRYTLIQTKNKLIAQHLPLYLTFFIVNQNLFLIILFNQRMISLEEHEKQVAGLNARMLALETQLLAVRNEVASLQETVKASAEEKEQIRKRHQQKLKKLEETVHQIMQINKRRREQEEAQLRQLERLEQEMIERENKEKIEQCEAQQRQFERLEQERLEREKLESNPQQPVSQPAHQSIFYEQKRRRDQYNRKALAEMAQIERREGPQEFAKYHMVKFTELEELVDIRIEHSEQRELIAQLQRASELKDQQISRLKKELEEGVEKISSYSSQILSKNESIENITIRVEEASLEIQNLKKQKEGLRQLLDEAQFELGVLKTNIFAQAQYYFYLREEAKGREHTPNLFRSSLLESNRHLFGYLIQYKDSYRSHRGMIDLEAQRQTVKLMEAKATDQSCPIAENQTYKISE